MDKREERKRDLETGVGREREGETNDDRVRGTTRESTTFDDG